MNRPVARIRAFALAWALLVGALPAHADFRAAVEKYTAKDYAAARVEFERLALLGDGASQFNLAAMALRGEGVPKDRAIGVGWMLAAAENGYDGIARAKLDAAKAELSPADAVRADAIVATYGKAAVAARVLPADDDQWLSCENLEPGAPGETPDFRWSGDRDGFVVVGFTVGVDGLAHDPEVVMSFPEGVYDFETVRSVMRGRHRPAKRNGAPAEMRQQITFTLTVKGGGALWNLAAFDRLRQGAAAGDPGSQYFVGVAGMLDSSLGMEPEDARVLVLKAGQGGVSKAQYWVARQFDAGAGCADAVRSSTWLEAAAATGYPRAQVLLARRLLSGDAGAVARARDLLRSAAASSDAYALKHVIALAVDPRLAPVDEALLREAGTRLPAPRQRVDPLEDEAAAVVLAHAGQWAKAVDSQRRALERAQDYAWNTAAIAERLAAYEARRTWSGNLLSVPARTTPAPPLRGDLTKNCDGRCERSQGDEKQAPLGTRLPK